MVKNISSKKIIIIGSSGFVGKSCVQIFKKNKIKFISTNSKKCNLLNKKSYSYLNKIVENGDTVLFISAIAPCKNLVDFKKNIQMLYPLLNLQNKIKLSKILYISSDAVYADTRNKINEKSKADPNSLHGLMHLTRENLLKIYFKDILTIIRPTLIYGPLDSHNGYGPNQFARLAKKNKLIKIFGKGEEIRDHIYIDDVARIVLITLKLKYTGIFNAVSGRQISFDKIAKLIIKTFKSKSKISYEERRSPMPHDGYRCFNMLKLKKKINFKPIDFNFGIKNLKKIRDRF